MAVLSKDQILANTHLPTEVVPVPEWGGEVIVKALSGRERDEFEASVVIFRGQGKQMTEGRDLWNVRAKLCAKAIVGEDGQRLFTDQDIAALGELSGVALTRVYEAASRLSGLDDDDVKELMEGFGGGPNGPSTSPSPSPAAAPSNGSSTPPPAPS